MTRATPRWITVVLTAALLVGGCAAPRNDEAASEHYVSPQVQGEAARINLDQVQQAFFTSKGSDFNGWMGAFEKRVNEIYDGPDIVSVDATRQNDRLVVTGFIDKNKTQGFQDGDDKLFTIEQTGAAANNQVPVRVATGDGTTYYEGHHSLLDNPFLQTFLIMGMMRSWGGHYYTPPAHVMVLRDHRDSYRRTPTYRVQQAENKRFTTRFKEKLSSGGFQSRRSFGSGGFSNQPTKRRSWFGGSGSRPNANEPTETHPRSSWGGRRSSSGSGSTRRSWGGRRR